MNDSLEHYGVLGMKWGVRKEPERAKSKRSKDPIFRWKDKRVAKINKLYAKAFKEADLALQRSPGDKSVLKYISDLKRLQKKDLDRLEKMSYGDVKKTMLAERSARRQKAIKTVSSSAMYAAKMSLIGVRIYGTFKIGTILLDGGAHLANFLTNTDAGAELVRTGYQHVKNIVQIGDVAIENMTGISMNVNVEDILKRG